MYLSQYIWYIKCGKSVCKTYLDSWSDLHSPASLKDKFLENENMCVYFTMQWNGKIHLISTIYKWTHEIKKVWNLWKDDIWKNVSVIKVFAMQAIQIWV